MGSRASHPLQGTAALKSKGFFDLGCEVGGDEGPVSASQAVSSADLTGLVSGATALDLLEDD